MANILDPISAVAAKVSAAGALHVTPGGDGFPTFMTRFGGLRITTAYAAGTYAWAVRAPAGKTVDLRAMRLRLSFDGTAAAATSGMVEFVRFSGADPAGGVLLSPVAKTISEGAATAIVREGSATAGPTLAGATIGAAGAGFGLLNIPYSVTGTDAELAIDDLTGLNLAPGEGLAIRCISALAIGTIIGGHLEFSEK